VRNLLTDVDGVLVGHAHDPRLGSGATAIVFETPAVTSVDVSGGGPGTHETDLLHPARTVERIDALTISGGSAFGLDAASGVQAWLREQGRGFRIRDAVVPIVPGAIMFDLLDMDTDHITPLCHLDFFYFQGRRIRALFPWPVHDAEATLGGQDLLAHFLLLAHARPEDIRPAGSL